MHGLTIMNNGTPVTGYAELHGKEQLNKFRIIADACVITPTTTILDVGCGTGLSAVLGGRLTGVDPSPAMLAHCPFSSVVASAECLPFPDRSFDMVISVTAIHLVADVRQALLEMRRVTRHGVVITLLRASSRAAEIRRCITDVFTVRTAVSEAQDDIFFLDVQ